MKDSDVINFIWQLIMNGDTFLDIGSKDADILSLMHKIAGSFKKIYGLLVALKHLSGAFYKSKQVKE